MEVKNGSFYKDMPDCILHNKTVVFSCFSTVVQKRLFNPFLTWRTTMADQYGYYILFHMGKQPWNNHEE